MSAVAEIFEWVWQSSVSATVLVALGLLVVVCFGKVLPVWGRYAIWLLVLGRLLMPMAPPASFSVWNLGKAHESGPAPVVVVEPAGYKPAIQQTKSLRHVGKPFPVVPVVWLIGFVGSMAVAVVRHRGLARWVRRQTFCTDERVLSLVKQAQGAFDVRGKVAVICNECFDVPAVFGARRPRVLLPADWLKDASDEELYSVLLHEMAHVKCRDPLLNWVCIFARCLHWFNPAAWYALRRLRCEREVFCDALVLARLRPEQRPIYGNTLIKMAAQLSGAAQPATLVPVLQHKPEIHRRVNMIAKYKSTPWMLSVGATLLIAALAGLTFTRAAEKKAPEPKARKQASSVQVLEDSVLQQNAKVRALKAESAKLREQAGEIPADTETLRKLEGMRIEAQADTERLRALYNYLTKMSPSDLKRSITSAAPDTQLSELMMSQDRAEQKLAEVTEKYVADHPEVKASRRLLERINKQIDDRMRGVLEGLHTRLSAEEAHSKALEKALDQAVREYRAGQHRARPYDDALQELRAQEEILQRLRLRLIQEQVDRAVEKGVR